MDSNRTDQDVVIKLSQTIDYKYDIFNRNDVFCDYITEKNKDIIPSQFCVLKLSTDSNADKYHRFIHVLQKRKKKC